MDGVASYYRGVLELLGHAEVRSGSQRRFGSEANKHWEAFAGDLTTGDRLDLLVRDADAQWPGSVGARTVFALPAVAEQDAFGPDWEPLSSIAAADLWLALQGPSAPPPAGTGAEALQRVAKAWGITLTATEVPAVGAADRLVVAGPSAVAALIAVFGARPELDWSAQVVVVATSPAHRQLAAAAGLLLNQTKPVRVVTATEAVSGFTGAHLITSPDAAAPDLARAAALTGN